MKTIYFFALLLSMLITTSPSAQTFQKLPLEDWSSGQGSQYRFHEAASRTDGSNNVHVAGATLNNSYILGGVETQIQASA